MSMEVVRMKGVWALLLGLLAVVLTACPLQRTETPSNVNPFPKVFQQANIPIETVQVQVQLPTTLRLVVTNGLPAPQVYQTQAQQPQSSTAVGRPKGFYTVARAYHVPSDDEEAIRMLGAVLIPPSASQSVISPESTATYLVAYLGWPDWVALGLPSLEAVETEVRAHPDFPNLVQRVKNLVAQGQDVLEDQAIDLATNIASDIWVRLLPNSPRAVPASAFGPQSSTPQGAPRMVFKGTSTNPLGVNLEVTHETAIPWAVGWLNFATEVDSSINQEVILPEASFAWRWLTGATTKQVAVRGVSSQYLVCAVPFAPGGGWRSTGGQLPLEDLLARLKGIVDVRGYVEVALKAASFVPGVGGLVAGLVDAGLDQDTLAALVEMGKAGVDATLSDVESSIQQGLDARQARLQALRNYALQIEQELNDPVLRKNKGTDAIWYRLANNTYKGVVAQMQAKTGKKYFTAQGKVDGRFSNQVGKPVLNMERSYVKHQIQMEEKAAQKMQGNLRLISKLGKALVVPDVLDLVTMGYDMVKFKDRYYCFDARMSGTVTPTQPPHLDVDPASISNGQRDTPYTFRITALHLTSRSKNFSLQWNFGDGTTGSRNVSAPRSPHAEQITHAYRNSGAYALTIQLQSPEGGRAKVVPVYIELPENNNDYNLNICNVWKAANGGGYGVTQDLWDISAIPNGAEFDISFNTYYIPDRIFVQYPPGVQVLDTGWRGDSEYQGDPKYPGGISGPGQGQFSGIFRKAANQNTFKVIVVGPDRDTAWDYSIRCRTSPSPQNTGAGAPVEVPPDPNLRFRDNPEPIR